MTSAPGNEKAPIAVELAKKQKAISVAEFFEKNRHMLGFDSLPRCLITCIKEAVDNSLDACEESSILPDIYIRIRKVDERMLNIVIEDNGPGIQKEVLPRVFGKLLYGSRFHAIRQSRGQQGIGISAAVLYGQLTSGRPTRITSKIDPRLPAYMYELKIDTETNEPRIVSERVDEFFTSRGTRVEIEMEAAYVRGKQSVLEYLRNTSIVNPHARITFIDPAGEKTVFERATDLLPKPSVEIKPHPRGIELGTLLKMLSGSEHEKMSTFLNNEFAKVGGYTAENLLREASVDPKTNPHELAKDVEAAKRLIAAFQKIKVMAPPKDCLSPITEDLLKKGVVQNHKVDFIATASRPVNASRGNPFLVEALIAYGGDLDSEGRIDIVRFANRVPLMYQQGACAITHAIERVNWKHYNLEQTKGRQAAQRPDHDHRPHRVHERAVHFRVQRRRRGHPGNDGRGGAGRAAGGERPQPVPGRAAQGAGRPQEDQDLRVLHEGSGPRAERPHRPGPGGHRGQVHGSAEQEILEVRRGADEPAKGGE